MPSPTCSLLTFAAFCHAVVAAAAAASAVTPFQDSGKSVADAASSEPLLASTEVDYEAATFLEPFSAGVEAIVERRRAEFPLYKLERRGHEVAGASNEGSAVKLCAVTTEFAEFDNNGGIGTFFSELVSTAVNQWGWDVTILYASSPDPEKLQAFRQSQEQQQKQREQQQDKADGAKQGSVSVTVLDCQKTISSSSYRNAFARHRTQAKAYCIARWLYSRDRAAAVGSRFAATKVAPETIDLPGTSKSNLVPFTGFDVVHFHENAGIGAFATQLRKLGIAFPHTAFVTTAHGDSHWAQLLSFRFYSDVHHMLLTAVERRQMADSDVLVSPSSYMLDHAKRLGWALPAHNSFVIPNLIRDAKDVFRDESISVDGQIAEAKSSSESLLEHNVGAALACGSTVRELVFLGRLEPRKGLAVMVDALQLLARAFPSHTLPSLDTGGLSSRHSKPLRGLTVAFMGRTVNDPALGDTATWVKAQHSSSGWGGATLKMLSDFGRDEVFAYFRHRRDRVAIVPSLNENSPYTVAECLHYGVPVIAAAVGGIPELIHPSDRNRTLFHPPTAASLAQKILNLLGVNRAPSGNSAGCISSGKNAVALAQPVLTSSEIAETWLQLHRRVILNQSSHGNERPANQHKALLFGTPSVTTFVWAANEPVVESAGPRDPASFVKRLHSILLAVAAQSPHVPHNGVLSTMASRVVVVFSANQVAFFNQRANSGGFASLSSSLQALHGVDDVRVINETCGPATWKKVQGHDHVPQAKQSDCGGRCVQQLLVADLMEPAQQTAGLEAAGSRFAFILPLDEMPLRCAVQHMVTAALQRVHEHGRSGLVNTMVVGRQAELLDPRKRDENKNRAYETKLLGTHYDDVDAWNLVQKIGPCSGHFACASDENEGCDNPIRNAQRKKRRSDLRGYLRSKLNAHNLKGRHLRDNEQEFMSEQSPSGLVGCVPADHAGPLHFPDILEGTIDVDASSLLAYGSTALTSMKENPLPNAHLEQQVLTKLLAAGSVMTLLDEQTLRTLPCQLFSHLVPSYHEGEHKGLGESHSPFASRLHAATAMLRHEGAVGVAAIETVPLPLAIPLSQMQFEHGSDEPQAAQASQQRGHSPSTRHLPAAKVMRDLIRAFELSETDLAWIAPAIVNQLGNVGDRLLHPSRMAASLPSLDTPKSLSDRRDRNESSSFDFIVADTGDPRGRAAFDFAPGFRVVAVADGTLVADADAGLACGGESLRGGIWVCIFDETADATGGSDFLRPGCIDADGSHLGHASVSGEAPSKRFRNSFVTVRAGELQLHRTSPTVSPRLEFQPTLTHKIVRYGHVGTPHVILRTALLQACGDGVEVSIAATSTSGSAALSTRTDTTRHINPKTEWQTDIIPLPDDATELSLTFGCGIDCYCDRVRFQIQVVLRQ